MNSGAHMLDKQLGYGEVCTRTRQPALVRRFYTTTQADLRVRWHRMQTLPDKHL